MAVHQPSVDRLVEVLLAIYEQEINELAKTPLISDPNRNFIKVLNEDCVSESDLKTHVVFLEHVMSDPEIRKCFYTFRAALLVLDQRTEHKLTAHANPMWTTSWVNREASKISAIWSYAQRRVAARKQRDGSIKVHYSRCTTVQRLQVVRTGIANGQSDSSAGSGVSGSLSDVASPCGSISLSDVASPPGSMVPLMDDRVANGFEQVLCPFEGDDDPYVPSLPSPDSPLPSMYPTKILCF